MLHAHSRLIAVFFPSHFFHGSRLVEQLPSPSLQYFIIQGQGSPSAPTREKIRDSAKEALAFILRHPNISPVEPSLTLVRCLETPCWMLRTKPGACQKFLPVSNERQATTPLYTGGGRSGPGSLWGAGHETQLLSHVCRALVLTCLSCRCSLLDDKR